jgi:hypothetical protein
MPEAIDKIQCGLQRGVYDVLGIALHESQDQRPQCGEQTD